MNYIDIIIIIIVIVGLILGYKDGFVRKLIGVIGFLIASYSAIKLASSAGHLVEKVLGIEYYLAEIIGGALVFIIIIVITAVIKRVVHPFDKVNNVINQILGAIIGACQMLLFLSGLLLLLNIFNFPSKEAKSKSMLHKPVLTIIPTAIRYVQNYTPNIKKAVNDKINDKDTDTTK